MYFEGWVLKYQVTIYEKIDKHIVSKSITKNEWNYQISGAFGAPKNLPKHTQIEGENKRFTSAHKDQTKVFQQGGGEH